MATSAAHRDFLSYLQRPFDVLVVHLGRGQVRFEGHLEGKRGTTLSRRTLNYCILLCTFFLFILCTQVEFALNFIVLKSTRTIFNSKGSK